MKHRTGLVTYATVTSQYMYILWGWFCLVFFFFFFLLRVKVKCLVGFVNNMS